MIMQYKKKLFFANSEGVKKNKLNDPLSLYKQEDDRKKNSIFGIELCN